ncbi:F-box/FBD/LRR-repeat protein At2g26030-like isoform X2 [Mercurialis annua]|uniref:F-box/FBD/LRR-repeat protein At2g26030-like isoform X2 n=1 Tax=Mercurialis annua TaxID=3986 RepID=UPI00215F9C38|nr:F-box/FBD/LRR-repeat protein At2g26030-like isoform X2 [Mercurialis annua]
MAANKRMRSKEIDRISELPDCLLHQIFCFLDSIDVVKTCILSKRWRYLWASSPYLNFKFINFYSSKKKYFINFINQFLLRRNSIPIHRFIYHVDFHVEASMVESWICYAVKHQVQHLTLQPFYPKLGTRFPFYFGGCTSLTTLKLDASHYESRPLPESLELPSLKNLHLIGFERCDGSIFSSFLNLETLKLEDMCFKGIQIFGLCALNLKSFDFVNNPEEPFSRCDFVIVAPKLRKFRFNGYPPFVCSTKNLCSLDLFEIDLPYNFEFELKDVYFTEELKQVFACEVLQMINAFHIAKSITLSMRVIQLIS